MSFLKHIIYVLLVTNFVRSVACSLKTSKNALSLQKYTCSEVTFILTESSLLADNITINFLSQAPDLVRPKVSHVIIWPANETEYINVSVCGYSLGRSVVYATVTPALVDFSSAYVHVSVYQNKFLTYVSSVCGWIYFVSWSVSFYPQVVTNYKRKSLVGYSLDFLTLNVVGHYLYAFFNAGLYWSSTVQHEYFQRHPRGLNPVLLNDVGFSIHASCMTSCEVMQSIMYDKGDQKVSKVVKSLVSVYALTLLGSGLLASVNHITMLDMLYVCSYIKLCITLIKYVPQALLNYKRKSTIGWSVGNVIMDFIGGIFSMLQMIIISYNYDDWSSIFGDLTKFGLGIFTFAFDILFLLQHYVFYKDADTNDIGDNKNNSLQEKENLYRKI